jgi:hypothetical protein
MRTLRRIVLLGGASVASVALAVAPVSAHECFNASRSDRANTVIAQHSHGWFDIQTSQFIAILVASCVQGPGPDCPPTPPSLTPDDVAYLQTTNFEQIIGEIFGFAPRSTAVTDLLAFTGQVATIAGGCGVPTHFLTLSNATAAGGAPSKVVTNHKGIDHFPDVYGQQLLAAYTQALGGPPAC